MSLDMILKFLIVKIKIPSKAPQFIFTKLLLFTPENVNTAYPVLQQYSLVGNKEYAVFSQLPSSSYIISHTTGSS